LGKFFLLRTYLFNELSILRNAIFSRKSGKKKVLIKRLKGIHALDRKVLLHAEKTKTELPTVPVVHQARQEAS
jgi:hypothetical protein